MGATDLRDRQSAQSLARIADTLESILTVMTRPMDQALVQGHLPAVGQLNDGSWGVFCLACTHQENEERPGSGIYIYPCRQDGPSDDWPPVRLVAPTDHDIPASRP